MWLSLIRTANRKTRHSRLLRRVGVRGYTSAVRANVFLPPPKVLLNGPPKSGTHLPSDCLSLMPRMMFSGRHFALTDFFLDPAGLPNPRPSGVISPPELDAARLERYLKRCPQGMFAAAHARFHPDLSDLVREWRFRQILLLRDPRDVAVSHSFYLLRDTLHQHHRYYSETLKSSEERLMASIRGFETHPGAGRVASMGESFGRYLPWMEDPSTLVVRFEDTVGPLGAATKGRNWTR